jgi:hypothetical protein
MNGQFYAPAALLPGEKAAGTHWIEGCVDPKPLWTISWDENSWPYRDSKPESSVAQPVASRYTDWAPAAQVQYDKPSDNNLLNWGNEGHN